MWRGSQVVKEIDPRGRRVMSSSLAPLLIRLVGGRCTLNLSRLKHSPVDVIWKLGETEPAQILSDIRSAIQHLCNWSKVADKSIVLILNTLKELSLQREIYLQWIPSNFGLFDNEMAGQEIPCHSLRYLFQNKNLKLEAIENSPDSSLV
ncbi:hypothetical protein TNCV_1558791 [Trichonephila clavipes]|nr:hypothetical protein TNCV_1558791 [Trichonephila clavipes]